MIKVLLLEDEALLRTTLASTLPDHTMSVVGHFGEAAEAVAAADGACGAWLTDIDGVVALGKTRDEVEGRMREALAAYAEYEREEGRELPPSRNYPGYASAP